MGKKYGFSGKIYTPAGLNAHKCLNAMARSKASLRTQNLKKKKIAKRPALDPIMYLVKILEGLNEG